MGGQNNLGGFILDYKASFAYTEQYVPWSYGYGFDNPNVTGSLTYNNTKNNGNSPSFNTSGLQNENDPTQFTYTGASNGTSTYEVSQYGGKADGKFDIALGGDDTSTVNFRRGRAVGILHQHRRKLNPDQTRSRADHGSSFFGGGTTAYVPTIPVTSIAPGRSRA